MELEGIVFDKDGTLYDFNATWGAWTLSMLREETGGDPATVEALAEILGYDTARRRFRKDSIVVAHTIAEVADTILPLLPHARRGDLIARMDARAARAPQVEATDLVPFLTNLRDRGLRLGVATNDSEGPARAHLAASKVEDLFDLVVGADSGHGHKPGPGQLLAFCDATRLDPARVAMVGDSTHDMMAGRAAGMTCIAVLTGLASEADLAPHADLVLPNIAQLPGLLHTAG
ncbi:HAD family hydrolase [Histidinibacterium aquaticum]|uniref:phosphoglycolate phosphatase n=1 Tax=Histidinibacterium aquaticum TaxID=2613962 RepID=A0A5J5GCX3_9RHOB|nr:HAD family hydrolase [Histidinibacterium aquaticum]KAA9005703.1 HAD family hydrolase [Histidinibacterium aquaticum]